MILVTGGAGYIGSHVVLELMRSGYDVIIIDDLSCGHRDIVENVLKCQLVVGDFGDQKLLANIFQRNQIDAVMHFSANAYVAESIENPLKYYNNNVAKTISLLECMRRYSIKRIIFSSSCTTYGIPEKIPICENQPQNPISPYGWSKLMVERILKDFERAYDLNYVIFRFFNAAGADPSGLIGEDHQKETHLIPLALFAAGGKRRSITVYGTDYDTPDSTCIRDYIHINDLAKAHLLGMEYIKNNDLSEIFNLGNERGFSVKEIIDAVQNETKKPVRVVYSNRRNGDPPILVGSSYKAKEILNWTPKYTQLEQIIQHAWHWHLKRHIDPEKYHAFSTNKKSCFVAK